MGQHKYNETAILASKGLIEPKPKRMGKAERERLMMAEIQKALYKKNPALAVIMLLSTKQY